MESYPFLGLQSAHKNKFARSHQSVHRCRSSGPLTSSEPGNRTKTSLNPPITIVVSEPWLSLRSLVALQRLGIAVLVEASDAARRGHAGVGHAAGDRVAESLLHSVVLLAKRNALLHVHLADGAHRRVVLI